jgi:hypothetical protein
VSRVNAYGEKEYAGPKYNEHYSFFGTRGANGCERREKKACRQKVELALGHDDRI